MDLNKSFAFSEEFDLDFGDISRVEPQEDDVIYREYFFLYAVIEWIEQDLGLSVFSGKMWN